MKIKSFLMIIFTCIVLQGQAMLADSSWSAFCSDMRSLKDFCIETGKTAITESTPNAVTSLLPESVVPSFNPVGVGLWSIPVWAGLRASYKGFNFRQPINSMKTVFNVSTKNNRDIAKLVFSNKFYGFKLATQNSFKCVLAGYLTGLSYYALFGKKDEK